MSLLKNPKNHKSNRSLRNIETSYEEPSNSYIVVAAVEANNGGPFFQNLVIIDGFYETEGKKGQEGERL